MIELHRLTKRFRGHAVLHEVDLRVDSGEIVGLIGGSGSGKTTLLKCVNGLTPFDSGEIKIDEMTVSPGFGSQNGDGAAIRRRVGLVFQHLHLWPYRTVMDNITEGAVYVNRVPTADAQAHAVELAGQFGIADQLQKYPAQLSGGQKQRVALARAIIMNPRYLLLDEITSALDPVLAGEIVQVLVGLRTQGLGILLVSHQIDFIRRNADRVCFLKEGTIWETGPAADVLGSPTTAELGRFIEAVRQGW